MTEYELLTERNSDIKIYQTDDIEFKEYGKIWPEKDLKDVYTWSTSIKIPEKGSFYQASCTDVEKLPVIQQIGLQIYGGLSFQAGPCCGYNNELNGIEYHNGSEVAICLKPCVMFLGRLQDMKDNTYDGNLAKAFFCKQGQIIQTYETTLHYTPCSVNGYFFTICFLPRGTGDLLENGRQGILKKKNKWFIAHPDNKAKVQAGDFPGLQGAMRTIK